MTPRAPLSRPPARPTTRRRLTHRPTPRRRKALRWAVRLPVLAVVIALLLAGWAIIARSLAPVSNTSLTRFDAIIVLGASADDDGNPTPMQLARVTEAVQEYRRGVAPRLILTGGAAHNRFVEAQVMARTAHAQGIPESAIFVEPKALDTIQNACYAVRIMNAHGWRSAEIVSSESHLPRAAMIVGRLPLEWRTHAAPDLAPDSTAYLWAATTVETLKTVRYLVWARWADPCNP